MHQAVAVAGRDSTNTPRLSVCRQVPGSVGEGALPRGGGGPRQRRRRGEQAQEMVGEGAAFGAAHV